MAQWKEHLQRAIDQFGSQAGLAEAMSRCGSKKYRQSHISWFLGDAEQMAGEDALAVHWATKGDVSASELRPDLWQTKRQVPAVRESARAAS